MMAVLNPPNSDCPFERRSIPPRALMDIDDFLTECAEESDAIILKYWGAIIPSDIFDMLQKLQKCIVIAQDNRMALKKTLKEKAALEAAEKVREEK